MSFGAERNVLRAKVMDLLCVEDGQLLHICVSIGPLPLES